MLRVASITRASRRFIPVQTCRRKVDSTARLSNNQYYFSAAASPRKNVFRRWQLPAHFEAPLVCALLGCTWKMFIPQEGTKTICESRLDTTEPMSAATTVTTSDKKLWTEIKRILRLIRRLIKLTIALTPIAALYPIQALLYSKSGEDAQEIVLASLEKSELPTGPIGWYFKLCFHCIEWSGAAAIKIMQWAGSRPDIFGPVFCSIFSQLQDDTTPHAWKHTEHVLREAYGEDWDKHIQLGEILGSGCIAQVYKGVVTDENGNKQEVAVKVMHPHVEDDIDADIDIMRLTIATLEMLPFDAFKGIKWLNLPGFIDEMDHMLKIQLDLRTEAKNLDRFNENFKDNDLVIIPKLIPGYRPTKSLLVEEFCEGVPIMDFVRNNTEDRDTLSEMCRGAIYAVCKMIFLDNFVHADLHPGNVLITPDRRFVLLDCGIVLEYGREEHRLLSDVLAAFIRCEGRKAGRRMIDDSNSRLRGVGDHAREEELYLDKIEKLTIEAKGKPYLMEKLGTYITYICNAAAQHHVMLNQTLISSALAVKVQEGIALALDPSVEIWRVAIPVILEGERRHGFAKERAQEMLGFNSLLKWLTGQDDTKDETKTR